MGDSFPRLSKVQENWVRESISSQNVQVCIIFTANCPASFWVYHLWMLQACGNVCNYFAAGSVAKYCEQRVCMFVCLFVRSHISKAHVQTSRTFLQYMLTVAVARCSSDDNVIRYVLPVCGWRHDFKCRIKRDVVSSNSPGGGTRGEVAVYDYRLVSCEPWRKSSQQIRGLSPISFHVSSFVLSSPRQSGV